MTPPRDLPPRFCFQCGGNANEPNHVQRCDGRQGHIEAQLPPVPAPVWRSPVASTPAEERAEKERDIERVARKVSPAWVAWMLPWVETIARACPLFTSETIWLAIEEALAHDGAPPPPVHDHRALGPLLRNIAYRQNGWIEPYLIDGVEQFKPAKRMSHNRPQRIWVSLIYEGGRHALPGGV